MKQCKAMELKYLKRALNSTNQDRIKINSISYSGDTKLPAKDTLETGHYTW